MVTRGEDVVVRNVDLERRDSGDRARRRPDLGREVRQVDKSLPKRAELVVNGRRELHPVAGVASETDHDSVQSLRDCRPFVAMSAKALPPDWVLFVAQLTGRGPAGRCSLDEVVEGAMDGATYGPKAAERSPVRLSVATDLDGTLLLPDGTLSERTIRGVRAGKKRYFSSSRSRDGRPASPGTWPRKPVWARPGVCSNGAAVVDLSSMEVIEVQTMQAEVTLKLVTVVREVFPGAVFAVEEIETFTHETGFMEPNWNWAEGSEQVDDIIEAVSSGCVKLVVRRPGWPAGALLAELKDQVSPKRPTSPLRAWTWVEMASPGITKAHAVQRVGNRLGVGVGEVLAIGDNYNDLTVLAWAGTAAVAPANAIPEVLSVVQQVLPSNGEDGVAQLLERLADGGADPRVAPSPRVTDQNRPAATGPLVTGPLVTGAPSRQCKLRRWRLKLFERSLDNGPHGGQCDAGRPVVLRDGHRFSATTSVRLCVFGPTLKNRLRTRPTTNRGSPGVHCCDASWADQTEPPERCQVSRRPAGPQGRNLQWKHPSGGS